MDSSSERATSERNYNKMKNNDPHLLSNLPAYNEDGSVHAVVEAPKGSLVKLKYEIKLAAFTVSHSLPLGLSYPFDWGFVPSTQAPDGDPLDILILHEGSTYPGVVLPCRPLGVVEMDQDGSEGKRDRNDRVIVRPCWHDHLAEFEEMSELPTRLQEEIEQFFLSTTFFTGKKTEDLRMEGAEKSLFNH
jgi:inorganic pyrophosphatase